MKLIVVNMIALIVLLIGCSEEVPSEKSSKTDILLVDQSLFQTKIYRSSDDSFQKNFYLVIEKNNATVYGWEIVNEKDTIYYRSICKLVQDSTGVIRIKLDEYQLTDKKIHKDNLNEFKENKDLSLNIWGAHSSFWGMESKDGSLDFMAVKHIYCNRADNFTFERL